jgi:hypothetical protein
MAKEDRLPGESSSDYMWRRKCEIFWEIESLWLKYMEVVDYPRMDFVTFVIRSHKNARDRIGAEYLIWVWKFVKQFSAVHVN